jgi:hypothetical protein
MIRLADNKGVWVTGPKPSVPPERRVRVDIPEKPVRVGYRIHAPRKYSLDAVLYGVEKRAEREQEDESEY